MKNTILTVLPECHFADALGMDGVLQLCNNRNNNAFRWQPVLRLMERSSQSQN